MACQYLNPKQLHSKLSQLECTKLSSSALFTALCSLRSNPLITISCSYHPPIAPYHIQCTCLILFTWGKRCSDSDRMNLACSLILDPVEEAHTNPAHLWVRPQRHNTNSRSPKEIQNSNPCNPLQSPEETAPASSLPWQIYFCEKLCQAATFCSRSSVQAIKAV